MTEENRHSISVNNIANGYDVPFDKSTAESRIEQMKNFWFNGYSTLSELPSHKPIGPLSMLIVQGSAFCNANCTYCYLPDRQNKASMEASTIEATAKLVFESKLLGSVLKIVWHAGEPLALPIKFYQQFIEIFDSYNQGRVKLEYVIQTNCIPINDKWCNFFKKHDIHVGVSMDGPKEVHDRYRLNWKNKGTFDLAMKGIAKLKEHNIEFSAIAVLTKEALDCPDELFEYFSQLQPIQLGFNVDEQEGFNQSSSLNSSNVVKKYLAFMNRFLELNKSSQQLRLRIREYEGMRSSIANPYSHLMNGSEENQALNIVSVAVNGDFSSFSPELLGQTSEVYGDWTLGNVHENTITEVIQSAKFMRIRRDIQNGIEQCKQECGYFSVCGGGAPSNKVSENGMVDSTETRACILMTQANCEVVLGKMNGPSFDQYSLSKPR